MPDPTPTPPDDKKPRKARGPIDSQLLDQLIKDKETINAVAAEMTQDAAFAAALASHFLDRDNTIAIDPASVAALSRQAAAALETAGQVTADTATAHDITEAERDDKDTAIAAIRSAQTRSKEKYEESHPAKLDAYFIGRPLKSRSQITLAGTALYRLIRTTDDQGNSVTPQDTLPGYDQSKIDEFKQDLGSYYSVQIDQSGAEADAGKSRVDFKTEAEQVRRRRRKIQLAIDAEHPYHEPQNTPLRRRIGLPTDKGLS